MPASLTRLTPTKILQLEDIELKRFVLKGYRKFTVVSTGTLFASGFYCYVHLQLIS